MVDKKFFEQRDYCLKSMTVREKIDFFSLREEHEYLDYIFPEIIIENCSLGEIFGPVLNFKSNIRIRNCLIRGQTMFFGAIFHGIVQFENCEFFSPVNFSCAYFLDNVIFDSNTFNAGIDLHSTLFDKRAIFVDNERFPIKKIFEAIPLSERPSFEMRPIIM